MLRRFTVLCLLAVACLARLTLAEEKPAAAKAADEKAAVKPLKVLLITGGCCHDYAKQKDILKEGLEARANIEVTVQYNPTKGTDTKFEVYDKDNWADGYDCIIHNECNANVKDEDFTKRILKPHREGLPAVVIHCAMHCYRDGTDEWFKFTGVTTRGHGPKYPFKIVNMNRDNPIMSGFGAEWTTPKGELYHIDKVWDTAKVLAHGERIDPKKADAGVIKTDACIWTNQYEKGRVFGTTVGHYNEEMSDPKFLNYVARGVLWSCDKLNDQYLKPEPKVEKKAAALEVPGPQPTLAPVEVSVKKK